jgi:hypothetical protein
MVMSLTSGPMAAPGMRWRRLRAVVLAVVVPIVAIGCGDDALEARRAWCARNQDDVARAALDLGMMRPGQRYEDWKYGDAEYQRACDAA